MLIALGIPQVGKKTGKILANFVFTLRSEEESIMEVLARITFEALESLHDIGPETARSVVEYIEENNLLIERLLHELDIVIPVRDDFSTSQVLKLSGKSFCVTGSFDSISRDAIHELIEKNGGENGRIFAEEMKQISDEVIRFLDKYRETHDGPGFSRDYAGLMNVLEKRIRAEEEILYLLV